MDTDVRSLRVLEVSLKKAGFSVVTTKSAGEALALALKLQPELVMTETSLPDSDGYALARRIKSSPRTSRTSVIFLSTDRSSEARVRGINSGADEFVPKPVLVVEILARVRSVLERRATEAITRPDRQGNLSGSLANMGVVDLLQIMETGRKSGVAHLASGPELGVRVLRGAIYFRDGQVIDAYVGRHQGAEAVYRLLMWDEGVFELEFRLLARPDTVEMSTQGLLLEGMRRIDEHAMLREQLPPLATRLLVDETKASKRESSEKARALLALFDGQRTIFEVMHESNLDEIELLETTVELLVAQALKAEAHATRGSAWSSDERDIETWLSSSAAAAKRFESDVPRKIPTVLERMMIPSRSTSSEIARATEPNVSSWPELGEATVLLQSLIRETTPIPELILDDSHIGPATTASSYLTPLESALMTPSTPPILLTQRTRRPSSSSLRGEPPEASAADEGLRTHIRTTHGDPGEGARNTMHDEPAARLFSLRAVPFALDSSPADPVDDSAARTHSAALTDSDAQDQLEERFPALLSLQTNEHSASAPARDQAPQTPADPSRTEPTEPHDAAIAQVSSGLDDSFFSRASDERKPGNRRGIMIAAGILVLITAGLAIPRAVRHTKPRHGGSGPSSPARAFTAPGAGSTKTPEKPIQNDPRRAMSEASTELLIGSEGRRRAEALTAEGEALIVQDSVLEAEQKFRKALTFDPELAAAHSGLAMALYNLEKDAIAKMEASRALALDPRNARAHLVLGMVATNERDYAEARRAYEKYLSLEFQGSWADEVRRILKAQP